MAVLIYLQSNWPTDCANIPITYWLNNCANTYLIYNQLTNHVNIPAIYQPTNKPSSIPDLLLPFDAYTILLLEFNNCDTNMPTIH